MYRKLKFAMAVILALSTINGHADLIDGEELVDPTRPLFIVESEGASTDVLAMINNVVPSSYDLSFIRAGNSPIAVINSERVTVGDLVGGATVISIDRSSVTLEINGSERVVSLYGDSIKTAVTQ